MREAGLAHHHLAKLADLRMNAESEVGHVDSPGPGIGQMSIYPVASW
jgi:hypothetical protein